MINQYVSRYVVPFYFEYENDGYSKLLEYFRNEGILDHSSLGLPKDCQWVEKGFWENYKADGEASQPEMDIYTYLLEVFDENGKPGRASNLGSSFVMKTNGNLLSLQYVHGDSQIAFRSNDLGVLIFRNGIGFAWYEIEFSKVPSVAEYVDFQHDFKELARTHSEAFRKRTGKDTFEIFHMGIWLAQLLNAENLGISFWAGRTTTDSSNRKISIPDKALLFQYLFVTEAELGERLDLAFRIANGYDCKYNTPDDLSNKIYEPFGNTCFYTSKTGSAYIVSNNESNAAFFTENFKGKFIRDYFFIYLLLLYQTYSSSHYSRLLTRLPADIKLIEGNTQYIDMLSMLDEQINLFLVKSAYDSVSNIQHQNGAYVYGKEALRIEENMKSLTVGLTALRGIEEERQQAIEQEKKEKKDRALNNGLTIFGFLVVASAGIDAVSLVDWFYSDTTIINGWHIAALGSISILTIFMFIVLVVNSWKRK